MSEASTSYWSVHPPQTVQNNQGQNAQHSLQSSSQRQLHAQADFLPPSSSHQFHAQYNTSQPELQLEYFHEHGGIDGFGVSPFGALQPQNISQNTVLGIGQGPGNAEPKYTAATATALAADACSPNVFQFGQQVGGSSRGSNTNPSSVLGNQQALGDSFSFSATEVSEGVPPHDSFQAQIQTSLHHRQVYRDATGYIPHQKRSRTDAGIDSYSMVDGSGSGDEEGDLIEQFGYNMEDPLDPFSHSNLAGQSPEMLSQIHSGLGPMLVGSGHVGNSSQRNGQGDHGQQIGPDGKMKPVHRAACVRCRNLKVRCEFTTDPNTCRRCLNGGHECAIPGRKKRRQPPKREHLLNQIRDQADRIDKLERQLEEHRRARLLNEPARLSLSNTPLPRPGAITVGAQSSSALGPGSVPQPDVQAWIERARESIQALGAFVEGEEDIEEQEEGSTEDDEYLDGQEDEHSWRDLPTDQDTDTEEGGIAVEEPDDVDLVQRRSLRESSPATTIRSASREGSAPPQGSKAAGRGVRRRTPQPGRLANLPETPAAPLKLIADLSISAAGSNRQGSKSPKNAPLSGMSSGSRGSSVGVEQSNGPTSDVSSPRSISTMTGKSRFGEKILADESPAGHGQESTSDGEYGAVAPGFFAPRRGSVPDPTRLAPARHPVPHILMRGIATPQEVESLFRIYFDKMNLSCSLLDPVLYTAQTTYWRSPFLFTVICAVASRYYSERPGLYEELITYAQLAAGTALISGPKTVETVSAYILLSLYPVPMRRWEEDRTWLYLGLAIRVATDLNLHHASSARPRNEQHERELLNRTRVWLNCCNLDISTSSWHGKSSTIPARDYIACHSEDWYESSPYNLPNFDIHLSGYNFELRLMRAFTEKIYNNPNNPTGLNKDVDFISLSSETDETLVAKEQEWSERLRQKTDANDPQGRFRHSLLKLAYRYARLTVLSFGFQHSFGKGGAGTPEQVSFFDRCYRAATDVVHVFIDELFTQKEYIRHGPEAQCVFVTFASAFLIKLLHPKYAAYLRMEQRKEIERLIRGIIDLLSSPEVVVDDRHSPKLWSRFLSGLLATPTAKIELSPSSMKGGGSLPRRPARRPTGNPGGSPSLATSLSGSASPPLPVGSSPNTSAEIHTSPSASVYSGTLSPAPPVLPASAPEDRYPALCNEAPNAAFDIPSVRSGINYHPETNVGILHSQNQQGLYDTQNTLQMDVPEFFHPPLPFDSDLLHQIGSMPDSSIWQNMPGFNWMGILQSSDQDSAMQDTMTSSTTPYNMATMQTEGIRF
ncbi:hypothetical protein ACEPAG_6800 [Sanghuangporus baumii]